jgi:hypothetical protein
VNWRYKISIRGAAPLVIPEPVGWDNCEITIKRDLSTHGIMFDYQGNDFRFYGSSAILIKQERDLYGVDGDAVLIIEEQCAGKYIELYRGRLLFAKYVYSCGATCYVKIPLETTSDVMTLRNKWDQKVDLYTLKGFDEVTDLAPYDKLPIEIDLPSKGIFIQDVAVNTAPNEADILAGLQQPPSLLPYEYFGAFGTVEVGFNETKASEIGAADQQVFPVYEEEFVNSAACLTSLPDGPFPAEGPPPNSSSGSENSLLVPDPGGVGDIRPYVDYNLLSPVINYAKEFPNYGNAGKIDLEYRAKGRFMAMQLTELPIILFFIMRVDGQDSVEWINVQTVVNHQNSFNGDTFASRPPGEVIPFDVSYSDDQFNLNKDDRIYAGFAMVIRKKRTEVANGENDFNIEFDTETSFSATTVSHTAVTKAKVFLVNEAFSRIAEGITNDKIRAYSEYFGRTDSKPYSVNVNGCGSLEAITNGLHVRRQEARNDQSPTLPVSIQDMFNGLEPVHHIGFGIEDDTFRVGFKRLRIEPWKFFYKSDVMMSCMGVNTIEESTIENEHYSTASFGYQKWEAEEYTGLDEFLTQRNYRTTLSAIKNDLKKLSSFIASGYAWEITRRLGNDNSKDWRYDNDLFLTCLVRARIYQSKAAFAASGNLIIFPLAAASFFSSMVGHTITITGSTLNNGTFTITNYSFAFGLVEISVAETLVNENADSILIKDNEATPADQAYVIELGNVDNPANIIDPPTIYNYRLTPARNAMRWMDLLLSGYRTQDVNSKIIFTDGTGNFIAEGEMADGNCRLENQVIAENQSLSVDDFADPNDAFPLRRPERVQFEYPMSSKDFKAMLADPYGFIYFKNNCKEGIGWIDEVKYKPEDGKATFTLIPAYGPELPPAFRIFMEQYNLVFQ